MEEEIEQSISGNLAVEKAGGYHNANAPELGVHPQNSSKSNGTAALLQAATISG